MTRQLDRSAFGARTTLVIGLLFAVTAPLAAQAPTGRIVGRIVDAETGRGISDAGIQVVGTTMGVTSGLDGRYALGTISAGTVTLHIRLLGYQPKTVTGLQLGAGVTLEQDISLSPATVQLEMTVVTADAERGSVNAALDEQRTATGIVNAITSEQIQKSPDGDAAQAVQRVSGVTVQDGKYVFVRGLGERYTTTALNGTRIPSPEPERKVIPLDLFPASLLQSVTTSKTFTPDQPGDFSGAQVNITTREFPAQRQISYSGSAGYNDRVTGKDLFMAPTEGMEWLGFGGGARQLPGIVAAQGDFSSGADPQEYNRVVNSFRNAWSARMESGSPNTSAGVSMGGSTALLGRRIGYIGSLTHALSQEIRADEVRSFAMWNGTATEVADRYTGSTGRMSVLWGGLFNLSSMIGTRSRMSLNNTYTRSADNEARVESGSDENSGYLLNIQRLRYVERSVYSSQLAGEHELPNGHRLDWALSAAGVTRVEPDRSEVVYAIDAPGGTPFLFGVPEASVRTFGNLDERSYDAKGDYSLRFGRPGREHTLKFGGTFRLTERDAVNNSYDIETTLSREDREVRPEEIFDGRHAGASDNVFRVHQLAQGGSYQATDVIGAGYAMMDYQLGDRVRIIGGARVERSALEVKYQELFGRPAQSTPEYTDVLPSLAVNFKPSERQNVRFAVSQTLARPEYREKVPINQRDVLGGEQFRGNPALRRSLIQNADVRWELYPGPGDVLSLGVFAKRFEDPIERVYRGTSGTRVTTFENAKSAQNYGVELEMRKGLGFLSDRLSGLTASTNVTVMHSEIDLSEVGAGSTNPSRAMVGQAPYVVNAGLGYTSASGRANVTALYNVVGERIFAASLLPLPSVFEQERHVLDLSARLPVSTNLSVKLDGKNLLDSPYEVTQGSVQREYYRAGRVVSLGLTWRQ
jgi:outer membrane receptor for ferrienterochelin and colicin